MIDNGKFKMSASTSAKEQLEMQIMIPDLAGRGSLKQQQHGRARTSGLEVNSGTERERRCRALVSSACLLIFRVEGRRERSATGVALACLESISFQVAITMS